MPRRTLLRSRPPKRRTIHRLATVWAAASGQWSGLLAALAGVVALVALLATGFLWWQYRQFYVSLSGADMATESALQRVRAEQRSVDERLAVLDEALTAARNREDALTARLDALPSRFVDLERQLSALQGVSFDARQEWVRAEVQYYLNLAEQRARACGALGHGGDRARAR